MPRDIFRRGVYLIEGRGLVEIDVLQRHHHTIEHLLNRVEITEKTVIVELWTRDGNDEPPIVAMPRLANTSHDNGMRSTELALDRHLKHERQYS